MRCLSHHWRPGATSPRAASVKRGSMTTRVIYSSGGWSLPNVDLLLESHLLEINVFATERRLLWEVVCMLE